MKRFLWTSVILILAGTMVYAQQPTSQQTKQEAQQFLNQGKSNSSQYDSDLANLTAMNTSNRDAANFNQLRAEIDRLDSQITTERERIKSNLDKGSKVSIEVLERYERLIDLHKAKLAELESFVSG